jgi:hypothetical protein
MTTKDHGKVLVAADGDYWTASCSGCDWQSLACDTKAEARDEHVAHLADVMLKKLGRG